MKKIILWICAVVLLLGAAVTGVFLFLGHQEEEGGYQLYYLNQEEDELVSWTGIAEESDPSALVAELYLLQQTLPEKKGEDLQLLLPENVYLLNFSLDGEVLSLNFTEEYTSMSAEREILVRAGMVRLFTQIQGVKKVQFQIQDQPLCDLEGAEIGSMTSNRFVENSGKEINSYVKTSMTLYFADKEGQKLVPEERNVYYNSNVPFERVVVEQLMKGPKEVAHMPTLPPEMNVLSVTIQDEICYVALDESFKNLLEMTNNTLKSELAVYSIVNSLADVCHVNKIQISINGKTNVDVSSFRIDSILGPNRELIAEEE